MPRIAQSLFLAVFALFFASACKEPECDPRQASAIRRGPQKVLEFTVGLVPPREAATGFVPQALQVRSLQTEWRPETHLSTGAHAELLDAHGRVLLKNPMPNLWATRAEFGGEVLAQGNPDHIRALDAWFHTQKWTIRMPELPEATTLRIVAAGAHSGSLGLASTAEKSFDFALRDIPPSLNEEIEEREFEVKELHHSGPVDQRLNFILIGDGYQESERARFRADAANALKDILAVSPYKDYAQLFNVWSVFTPSAESGASCDDHTAKARKNYFGTSFPLACINAAFGTQFSDRFILQTHFTHVQAAVRSISPLDFTSEIFVISNSPLYGGSAVIWASQSNNSPWEVVTHELGHSFGGLADEYVAKSDICSYLSALKPNVSTLQMDAAHVKWSRWIDNNSTPIPTPSEYAYHRVTGLFTGAGNCESTLFRPELTCKMKTNGGSFCQVCHEQVILRFFDRVRPLAGGPSITALGDGRYRLEAPVKLKGLKTTWYLDRKALSVSESYEALETQISKGKHQIAVSVQDTTPRVRKDRCSLFQAAAEDIEIP